MRLPGLDRIYVINVRSFEDRRRHVTAELARFGLEAEFILEWDAVDLTPDLEAHWFASSGQLTANQRSCALKHVTALQRIVGRGECAALVLEDDVVLAPEFREGVEAALAEAPQHASPHVLFIGCGGNFYTPRSQRKPGQHLYPASRGRFADSYIIGADTARRRLDWIAVNRIALPIDNQFEVIDRALGISMLWFEEPVVEQGSKNGMFKTSLEAAPARPIQRLKFAWEKLRRKYLYQVWR